MSIRAATLLFAFACSTPGHSGSNLSGDSLEAALFGTTITGEYASGERFQERYDASGRVVYRDSRETSQRGTARVVGPTICFEYDDASMSGGCFKVRAHGDNCFAFHDAASLATSDRTWVARGWREGERSTCPDVPVS